MPTRTESPSLLLADPEATETLGRQLAAASGADGLVVYLYGDLGAGKTSLARAWLSALGAGDRIKSPTYSLIEPYTLDDGRPAWHLDLYRIADPGELEWLGLDALADPRAVILIEWPQRGAGALPAADLSLHLEHADTARRLRMEPSSARGERLIESLTF
ncbi:tRNA (adenosine(37)-N6)-threonylcarbamoyltransferase complex ATPase subunit type 1 TsaE [Oleiagrimonas sp. MCCC 1A03011]|jgi:tRNA threonylcarbamoyladenosine biosynthesis protein TsaE|uniref:tRNA (adenosine(37)-N6)-threonylcarbamoyltransferase complex ATPase subunit type 1 TsaE n=1 Tax=Oleiagrimonas sp. MCCC 1A03011 TaxID=1926883 RepID=UPI000DC38F28|nr:tRNA (adenosine(37)-N6)-threonylcarbamoyltransferase complex ATPase subunit type 1 TsaE [Oleiagrimonas sp. MCCC 1A03011]RAP57302.1 tRNA (adenosine(37)-N6)-threonylcarbamoyltransferase complex ATPase subunit type 1 TsaE [Oleiagrimonas sp. MCCC 1A03011]